MQCNVSWRRTVWCTAGRFYPNRFPPEENRSTHRSNSLLRTRTMRALGRNTFRSPARITLSRNRRVQPTISAASGSVRKSRSMGPNANPHLNKMRGRSANSRRNSTCATAHLRIPAGHINSRWSVPSPLLDAINYITHVAQNINESIWPNEMLSSNNNHC